VTSVPAFRLEQELGGMRDSVQSREIARSSGGPGEVPPGVLHRLPEGVRDLLDIGDVGTVRERRWGRAEAGVWLDPVSAIRAVEPTPLFNVPIRSHLEEAARGV
jgi:hypothetical protein